MKKTTLVVCVLVFLMLVLTACTFLGKHEDQTTTAASLEGQFPLVKNGSPTFSVIMPSSQTVKNRNLIAGFATSFQSVAEGIGEVEVITEDETPSNEYEICFGEVDRDESLTEWKLLGTDRDFRIKVYEKRIVVVAKSGDSLKEAIDLLLKEIKASAEGKGTTFGFPMHYEKAVYTQPSFPGFNNVGSMTGAYNYSKNASVYMFRNVSKNIYQSYLEFLTERGCTVEESYSIGANEYKLLKGDGFTSYVSFLSEVNALRVYVGPEDDCNPEKTSVTSSSVKPVSLWQLEVDTKGSKANGGMSYVIQLSDGSYIILDGGYSTDTECNNLYELLLANKPASHAKPIVSAWFITHLHVDHYGCMSRMTEKHLNDIEVKAFYYNFPTICSVSGDLTDASSVISAMNKWKNAKQYAHLHSGMSFGFAGVGVQVLCTFEDVCPRDFSSGNDTSTVLMMTVNGQKILFLADAEKSESDTMATQLPNAALKCDILQYSHHGYEGCTQAFYQIASPTVILWPMNVVGWQGKANYSAEPDNVIKKWYHSPYVNQVMWESGSVKQIILSGAGTTKISLPYSLPTQRTRPDLDALFTQKKSEQQVK